MKKPALIILALLMSMAATSQVDSLIYGISTNVNSPGLLLSGIDVANGNVEKISDEPVPFTPGGQGRTIDARNRIFYYATGNHLLAFDLKSGELIREAAISGYMHSIIFGLAFNYRDSTLYALAVDTLDPGTRLVIIDQVTGAVNAVSGNSVAPGCNVLPGTALDPIHGIYYFQTYGNPTVRLLGINLHSGSVVTDVPIGIDTGQRFGPMEYNCRDSTLYGLKGSLNNLRKLARINPVDGVVTVLSTFPSVDTLLNEQATIDPFRNIFYFEAMDRTLRGIGLASGDLVQVVTINPLPDTYFSSFLFNNTCFVPSPSSVDDTRKLPEVSLFPNPVPDHLWIRSSALFDQIGIFDLTGILVHQEMQPGSSEICLDLTRLEAGMYIIRIWFEDSVVSLKFIKTGPKRT